MRKIGLLGSLSLLSFALASCGQQTAPTNMAPSVVGVKGIQCIVNTTVDLLDGVAALDKEDGDITPNLEIAVTPHVDVVDGYATFEKEGEYAVNYKITDSEGRVSQKNSYVEVVAREKYTDFALPAGFSAEVDGAAKFEQVGMVDGKFVVKAKGHEVAEDVQIKRTFELTTNLQYTFKFEVDSKCEGKVKALADGATAAEMKLIRGRSTLSFKHIALAEEAHKDVEIALCFGNIEEDIDLTIVSVETEYPQEAGAIVDLTENFTFAGRVISRIENGNLGNTWSEDEGHTAVLEITQPNGNIWEGGMFINTGITTKKGVTYTISFQMECEEDADYEIIIQRDQWKEQKIETIYNPGNSSIKLDITPDETTEGALWIYVQSGNHANRIRMHNLKIEEHLAAIGHDAFLIEDYHDNHSAGTTFHSTLGDFTYEVEHFGDNYNSQEVMSPAFFVNGSGGNYVLSFKAKASAPVEAVVAAPVAGGWDPTLMWSRILIDTTESTHTFFFSGAGSDRDYTVVWQFGGGNNVKYENVKIEVSDVSITLRNRELDG